MRSERGSTFVELLVGLAIVSCLVSLATPATAHAIDSSRVRDAAGFVASRLRMARQLALVRSRASGLVFDEVDGQWEVRVCEDGNGNGLRRAEIVGGVDRCAEGPFQLGRIFHGVLVSVDASLRGPDGEPGSPDPVRFGSSDIATFSPEGSATAGSLYLRSARGQQFVVRVGNITGRTRVLRYDPGSRTWR